MSDDPTARILAAIEALRGDMGQLRADMIARTDGLRADMGRLRVDVMGRIDRLQNSFSSMQQDITVNFAASDRVERAARNATDETRALADQVNAMERQIRLLGARVTELENGGDGHPKRG